MNYKGERDLAAKLVPRGEWDAFAFVDEQVALLRKIATQVALEHFPRREGG